MNLLVDWESSRGTSSFWNSQFNAEKEMKCYSNDGFPRTSHWELSLGEEARGIFFFYSAVLLVMAVTAI